MRLQAGGQVAIPPPTYEAVGALFKLIELGGRVPDDVSFIGYDNAHLAMYTFPKLTTIFNPVEDIADNAPPIFATNATSSRMSCRTYSSPA
jgi:DNA-binding LacI/PurR family transcriptional regulator